MKKILSALCLFTALCASGATSAFIMPDPEFNLPFPGQSTYYGSFSIVWGYYELEANASPMTATLTFPDGTVKQANGKIADASLEGEFENSRDIPAEENNCLLFQNVYNIVDDIIESQTGKYTVEIPAGIVKVNGMENEAATLHFYIGVEPEESFLPSPTLVYPSSIFTSYLSVVEISWGEPVTFVDGSEEVELQVLVDGEETENKATASIKTIQESNEADKTTTDICVIYVSLPDFGLSYNDGTTVSIVVPEGLVANSEGLKNSAKKIVFTLLPQIEGTATPAGGTTFVDEEAPVVEISWEGVELSSGSGFITVREIQGEVGEPFELDPEAVTFLDDKAAISIDLSSLGQGTYEIEIPEGYVLVVTETGTEGTKYAISSEMYLEYTIPTGSGVGSLTVNEGNGVVYDLVGRKIVEREGTALPSGIYIKEGRKILVP